MIKFNVKIIENEIPTKDVLLFAIDILDKRYHSYMWCETKVYTHVTLNSLLAAALVVMIDKVLETGDIILWWLTMIAIISLGISLVFALYHIMPKMNSGKTTGRNIRTIIGTENYSNNEDYNNEFLKLNFEKMIQLTTEQIRGMNTNIMKSQKSIKWAALFSTITVMIFLTIILKYLLGKQ